MMRSAWFLILLMACGPTSGSGSDDDDTTAADDDDAATDDDDSTPFDVECDDATLEPIIEALGTWELQESCTNARMSIGTADQQTAITLFWLITDTPTDGATWALYFDGTEPGDAVQGTGGLLRGSDLMTNECSANPTANPVTNEAWDFTAGEARITVTDSGTGSAWEADVTMSGAVVTLSASTTTCQIPDITWSGVTFGLPPD
jgi:hypothetical protein